MPKYQVYYSLDEISDFKWWVCTIGCYQQFCIGKFLKEADAEDFCEVVNERSRRK